MVKRSSNSKILFLLFIYTVEKNNNKIKIFFLSIFLIINIFESIE